MPRIFTRRHKLVKLNGPRALEHDTDDKLSDGEMLLDFLLVASINQPLSPSTKTGEGCPDR